MNVLNARELAANIPVDRRIEFLDLDVRLGTDHEEVDCWPDVAVGGLIAIGWLPSIEDERQFCDGLRHLGFLADNGLVDRAEWEQAALGVVAELMRQGDLAEQQAAGWN